MAKIKGYQIEEATIPGSKLTGSAGITDGQLATSYIKQDGTRALTGNLSMGNNKVTSVGTPTPGSADAARILDVESAIAGLASIYKYRTARVASTANVNVSNPGTATFDGVVLANGERILLKDQSTQSQNGLYIFNGSGSAMTRAAEADAWSEFPGMVVTVSEGAQASANGTAEFRCTVDDGGTLGTTSIVFVANTSNGLTNSNFVDEETPSGTVDGSNATFTLANTPSPTASLRLYVNGLLQQRGAGKDFTISTNTITFATAPQTGDWLVANYRK